MLTFPEIKDDLILYINENKEVIDTANLDEILHDIDANLNFHFMADEENLVVLFMIALLSPTISFDITALNNGYLVVYETNSGYKFLGLSWRPDKWKNFKNFIRTLRFPRNIEEKLLKAELNHESIK